MNGVWTGVAARSTGRPAVLGVVTTAAIVALTLGTAYIHYSLGGWLFVLNALGYVTLAAALVAPVPLAARLRWLVRLALLAFTLATIVGWAVMGPRYSTAYVAKLIEVAIVALVVVDVVRLDGGPRGVARAVRSLAVAMIR